MNRNQKAQESIQRLQDIIKSDSILGRLCRILSTRTFKLLLLGICLSLLFRIIIIASNLYTLTQWYNANQNFL